jgi:hypothetical protein
MTIISRRHLVAGLALLAERPTILGLAVPGMPVGAPGMEVEGEPAQFFQVIAFSTDGSRQVFG